MGRNNTLKFYLFSLLIILSFASIAIYYLSVDDSRNQIILVKDRIIQHLESYTLAIDGARSLMALNRDLSLNRWEEYFDGIGLTENYPGLSSVGYSASVPKEDIPDFEAKLQSIYGDKNIRIRPQETPGKPLILTFVYPLTPDRRSALGLNVASRPEQIANINHAILTGLPSVSSKSDFVTGKSGFSISEPIFELGGSIETESQRAANFTGVIGASFYTDDFFGEIFENNPAPNFRIRIYDGRNPDDSDLYYDSDPDLGIFMPAECEELFFLNAVWTLCYKLK